MKTPWTDKVDPSCPLPEYPRPQLRREGWLNLNGKWEYAITKSDEMPSAFDGQILVPFSPETELSGVQRALQKDEFLWYRREVTLPEEFFGKRIILHFGAVDQIAMVWVNNIHVATHVGGYLPFEADISEAIGFDSFTLVVAVTDETDAGSYSRGKQSSKRGGIWYTPQSGIWQTVWLEAVPDCYIDKLKITPDIDRGVVEIAAEVYGIEDAYAEFDGKSYLLPAEIPVEKPELWTPDNPKLYDFSVVCGEDRVESYFAMRKISVEKDEKGIMRLFLNNKPLFQNGLLDQGYWPDGLYTAPSDEALIYDIETAKAMGFNTLRKHIKVEPLRWYYHCDRLGMLVWQDMPSGGGKYNPAVISVPVVLNISLNDKHYKLFAREDEAGREQYKTELSAMVEYLYNCPCIVMWVPFNEGWGQFDSREIYELITRHDKTRVIDHASGWHDQKISNVRSDHVYFRKYRFRADKLGRAVMLSEFGGYNYRAEGHCFNEKDFGYKRFNTAEELAEALEELYQKQIKPAVSEGLAAAIYTQLSDVEDELNGLLSYDRQVLKLESARVREIISLSCKSNE